MATGREERMQQRMRGAGRHQVEDVDFGPFFTIPAPVPSAEPSLESEAEPSSEPAVEPAPQAPVSRTISNSSAKRRRLDSDATAAPVLPPQPQPEEPSGSLSQPPRRQSSRNDPSKSDPSKSDPYDLDDLPTTASENEARPETTRRGRASARREPGSARSTRQEEELPTATPRSAARIITAEEVTESPADAPGSGHRRTVQLSGAASSSAALQSALRAAKETASDAIQSSSPLSRKSRKSRDAAAPARSSRLRNTRRSPRLSADGGDGHSLQEPREESGVVDGLVEDEAVEEVDDSMENVQVQEPEEPEEINDREVARQIGRKRPRMSLPVASPELDSTVVAEEPTAKRPRKAPPKKSPAKQKQPKAPAKKRKPVERREVNDNDRGPPVQVKIQRYTKPRPHDEDDPDGANILQSEIPYANRGGVNAIDVLAQMCEEIIEASLESLQEAVRNAKDAAEKRESRTKARALEAFREELRTRLLEHTIALDTLHALKKRVRDAQKKKLGLRDRIIQIRAEREQVALRMDAVRIKHEEESKEALHHINLSSAMHDIDLAVEQGRAAPELSEKEQKIADLANLELLISRVTDQACSSGPGGGTLEQIKSFNAFLERAAAVL